MVAASEYGVGARAIEAFCRLMRALHADTPEAWLSVDLTFAGLKVLMYLGSRERAAGRELAAHGGDAPRPTMAGRADNRSARGTERPNGRGSLEAPALGRDVLDMLLVDRLDVLLAIERWGGLSLGLSALAAPFVLPIVGYLRPRRHERRGRAAALGCASALVYSPLAFVLAVCHGVYVGDGPRAQVGFAWGAPVVAALERHRSERGAYPDSLTELVPDYLPGRAALRLPERGRFSRGPRYARDGAGYTLEFGYAGPGMNVCTYTPAARRWECGTYF